MLPRRADVIAEEWRRDTGKQHLGAARIDTLLDSTTAMAAIPQDNLKTTIDEKLHWP